MSLFMQFSEKPQAMTASCYSTEAVKSRAVYRGLMIKFMFRVGTFVGASNKPCGLMRDRLVVLLYLSLFWLVFHVVIRALFLIYNIDLSQ
jgi:hypothetical protein